MKSRNTKKNSKRKILNKRWKRIVFRISLAIIIFISVIIIFISPIAKYVIQKYDMKLLGREVTLDWVYINPFTGYVHLDDLKIYEAKSDSVFFSVSGISANVTMYKLLSKTYEISSLTINNPKGNIVRIDNKFNFNDLILKFSDTTKKSKEPLHFNILDIDINNGEFYLKEPSTPIDYSFLKINFTSDGYYWDRDTINGKLSLISGIGSGFVDVKFLVDTKAKKFKVAAILKDYNLNLAQQYLKALASYGHVEGKINADVKVTGNFNNKKDIDAKGNVEINGFHFGRDSLTDYVSFKKLTVVFKQIAPVQKIFMFDSIRLETPIFKYEKYDYLDNLQNMFGKGGSKIQAIKDDPEKFNLIVTISTYIQSLFKNFFKSEYKINSLAIVNANIKFNDFSTNTEFSAALNPLNISGKDLDSRKKSIAISINSGIKPYGDIEVAFSINPKNMDFNIDYKVQKVPVSLFNPYTITYTSFPLNRGKIELSGSWQVRNHNIESNNHLIIIDPRVSKRIRKKDTKWIPVPLIMAIIRERGNVIDYEIPIKGNLKDPKFNFVDPIVDAIENIFVKPATTPYRYKVKNTEKEIEKSFALTWYLRQATLNNEQERFLRKISNFLKDNPKAKIIVHPMTYADKEKEDILFFEAKKKYYLSCKKENQQEMTGNDSMSIEKLSSKDSLFLEYLNKKVPSSLLFTVQDKCYRLLGADLVNNEYTKLLEKREKVFIDYFKKHETNKQIKLFDSKRTVPFNGFSYFKINYNGDIPEELSEAFEKLSKFNDNAPRDRYKKFRKEKKL